MKRNGRTINGKNGQEPNREQVLTLLVNRLETLHFLEALYGYLNEEGCTVVAVANDPVPDERDAVWEIEWEFIAQYPKLAFDIRLIPRRDQPTATVFQDDGTASITPLHAWPGSRVP